MAQIDSSGRIDAAEVRAALAAGTELALVDVREHGQYGEGHPFFAVNAPYSRLELVFPALVPRRDTRVVLVDDNDGIARLAAVRLGALGYREVHVLDGGVQAWQAGGLALFQGVHVPSKTFGEWVEHAYDTPRLTPAQWQQLHERQPAARLLDGRTHEEHRRMTIPGALPLPNGELVARLPALLQPDTPVVVHCAGRTRSIIGAQTLRNLGLPNPVWALENGTQGWALAGLALEHGSKRPVPALAAAAEPAWRDGARSWARAAGVAFLEAVQAQAWLDDATRTTYVFDVRTREEYDTATLPGAVHAPGGQLIQATDLFIGVRGARVILLDDDGARACVIASWLSQMGLETAVVAGGIHAPLKLRSVAPPALPAPIRLDAADAARALAEGRLRVLDLRSSRAFRVGHPAGAQWWLRPRLARQAPQAVPGQSLLLLVDDGPDLAALVALEWSVDDRAALRWMTASDWQAAGLPWEVAPDNPTDADAIDYLYFVHDRHDGNLDAARRYLAWETGLLAQCAPEELARFRRHDGDAAHRGVVIKA